MNAIIFSNLLKNQLALRHLDSDILEALLEQYPYSQPIRRLLRQKSEMTKAEAIQEASSTEIDHLPLFYPPPPLTSLSSSPMSEIEENDAEIASLVPIEADLEEEVLYFDIPDRKKDGISWQTEAPNEITMGKKKNKKIIEKFRKEVLKQPGHKKLKASGDDDMPNPPGVSGPNPKKNFKSWIDAQAPIVEEEELNIPDLGRIELSSSQSEKEKKKSTDETKAKSKKSKTKAKLDKGKSKTSKKKKKKEKKSEDLGAKNVTNALEKSKNKTKVKHFARESVKNRPSLISETLATLLAKQGHIEKSIAMYEKLRLLIPEKSHFFASQIQKLKNI